MNIKKLIEKSSENWVVKIVCFMLALLIYFLHNASKIDKKILAIPLTVVSEGETALTSSVPKYVKVYIRTKMEDIGAVNPDGIAAELNLNHYAEAGIFNVPVNINVSPNFMDIDPLEISVKPEKLQVELDKKILKYIPIEPAVSGSPKHGYIVDSIKIIPHSVKAVGAASILNKVEHIYTEEIEISGSSPGFSSITKLQNINSLIDVMTDSEFKVKVTIIPAPFERVFENIIPKIIDLNEKFIIEGDIESITLKASGTVPALEKFILPENTLTLNCSKITEAGIYELPLSVNLPFYISVKEKSADRIKLSIIEKVIPVLNEDEKITDIITNKDSQKNLHKKR